jgi:hypothetical protein
MAGFVKEELGRLIGVSNTPETLLAHALFCGIEGMQSVMRGSGGKIVDLQHKALVLNYKCFGFSLMSAALRCIVVLRTRHLYIFDRLSETGSGPTPAAMEAASESTCVRASNLAVAFQKQKRHLGLPTSSSIRAKRQILIVHHARWTRRGTTCLLRASLNAACAGCRQAGEESGVVRPRRSCQLAGPVGKKETERERERERERKRETKRKREQREREQRATETQRE